MEDSKVGKKDIASEVICKTKSKLTSLFDVGDVLKDVKVYNLPRWEVVKKDGEIMLIFTDMQLTVMHIESAAGLLRTDVRGTFRHYNTTENDKGTHHASLKLSLLGNQENELAVPYPNIWIERDACGDRGITTLEQVQLPTDVFAHVVSFGGYFQADWTYEGKC